jgi:hypothetical protein
VTDSIAWVNPRDFNGGASFFRSTARPFFFVFADCATGQKCSSRRFVAERMHDISPAR